MFQSHRGLGNQYGDDTIDIKAIVKRFVRRWYYFVIGVVLFGSLGVLYLRVAPRIWRVQAKVILDNQNAKDLASEQFMKELGLYIDKSGVEDKAGVLNSYNLVRQTLANLPFGTSYFSKDGLKVTQEYKGVPFVIEVDSAQKQLVGIEVYIKKINDKEYSIKAEGNEVELYDLKNEEVVREVGEVKIDEVRKINEPFDNGMLSFSVRFKEDYDTYQKDEYFFKLSTLDGLAEVFQEGLEVTTISGTSAILTLVSEGPVVEIEKLFINTLLETYKQKELAEMFELGNRTVNMLDSQLTEITYELDAGNQVLKTARNSANTLDPGTTEATIQRSLMELQRDRIRIQTAYDYYFNVSSNLEKTPDDQPLDLPSPSSLGITDQVLNTLIMELSKLNEDKQRLEFTEPAGGPLTEVADLKIKNRRREIIANVKSSLLAKKTELNGINRQIGNLGGKITSLPRSQAEIQEAENSVERLQERYNYLVQKKTEAMIAMNSVNNVDIEVIESARLEDRKPISPKKPLILLMSLFLGMALPIGIVILQDFFHNKIGGEGDIQSSTNIPVLGFVARHDRNSNYIVPKDSRTALAESFRSIRIKMQYLNDNVHQQIVGLTSSSSGEGKTFCATNLAAVMAQAGKRTLLIDIDLRRPRVTRYFENGDGSGLSTYLSGEIDDYKHIVHKTHIENLEVIHSGPVCTNPLDLIATEKMTKLIAQFRKEYDHIVLDTPPLGLVSDYLIIKDLTDFNIYVVRDSTTSIDSLKWINELYDNEKIKNVAMLINDVKSVADYGYINNHYGYGD